MRVFLDAGSQVDLLREGLLQANVGDGEGITVLLRVEVRETGELIFTHGGINPQKWYGSWTYRLLDVSSLPVIYPTFEVEPGFWWLPALISISADGIEICLTAQPYPDIRVV